MNKKNRDPYPITDVYLLEMNAVDAAKKILKYKKVKINGISQKTLMKL
tara:strand:+ start:149 stop:292 length:144 start_codon:yes stop_codon:yes gene_type:complete